MDARLLERAEEMVHNARTHAERGVDDWARAFLVVALELIQKAKETA